MVMSDGAAQFVQYLGGCDLDLPALLDEPRFVAERMEREVRRRAVRINVREAAGYDAGTARDLLNRTLGSRFDLCVEVREAIPRDRRLERLGDDPARGEHFAVVRHTQEA